MERLTRKHDFFDCVLPEQNAVGDNQATEISLGETEYTCKKYIVGEAINHFAKLEDVLEKYGIKNLEEYISALIEARKLAIEEKKTQFKKYIEEVTKGEKLEQELAELKQKAIVLPFEFDKPIYKLCPKCNDKQTDCKHCAWGGCGFNQCYDICHKENKGQIIREIIFKKDNCNVSWNAIRFISEHWGEYYFATKEEAEQKLAEIKGNEDE